MNLRLHSTYGVNPSVSVCVMCDEGVEVVLFGAAYAGEAPRQVLTGPTFCDACKKKLVDLDGIALVEAREVETRRQIWNEPETRPEVTGCLWVIRREAVLRLCGEAKVKQALEHGRIMLILPEAVDKIGLRGQKGVLDEE